MSTLHTFTPAGWPSCFDVVYRHHDAEPATKPSGYSLGDPPISEHCEIEDLKINGESVMEFMDARDWIDHEELSAKALEHYRE